jgi:putative endonuclease
MKIYSAYILTNHTNSVLYTGVTNDLKKRVYEHKQGENTNSFTKKYRCYKLVWFEYFKDVNDAIAAEKKIKGWTRDKKITLIKSLNPTFKDLII